MKTAISIPDPVFEAAEKLARRTGVSRSQLYTNAVKEYLEEHQRWSVTKKLNEVYAKDASGLDHTDQQLQYSSLDKETW